MAKLLNKTLLQRIFCAGFRQGSNAEISGLVSKRGAPGFRSIVGCSFQQHRRYAQTAAATATKPDMFCYQCEQTKSRKGCVTVGVCGKSPQVAALQDLLLYVCQGLAVCANRAINMGVYASEETNDFILKAFFSTLTNVNFDPDRFQVYIMEAVGRREEIKDLYIEACKKANKPVDEELFQGPVTWVPEQPYSDMLYLESEGKKVGVLENQAEYGTDINGVRYMTIYGIKGMAAYAAHAIALGERDPWISKFIYQTLDFLTFGDEKERHDLTKNLQLALKVGETNMRVLEMLDRGHRRNFGTPSPTKLHTMPRPGKCILVSGHDIKDLHTILIEADKHGIDVYTHGEMMPAHGYPKLREFKSLAGHFGGAWQTQRIDFAMFPGPVVITTNCVIEPLKSYKDRLYTLNETGIHGIKHLSLYDAEDVLQLMQHANSSPGFTEASVKKFHGREIDVGFGREVILDNAATVLEAVKTGELQRVFLIGGCDGSEHKRNYFTNLATSLPPQTLILTMGCAKYRINLHDYGTLGNTGIPRLLDMGQCNDSFGAVMVAKALADALDTDINSLPLSISLSWFEQKAVAVLLSLLSLGVRNIRLGPVMPAFMTPKVRQILEDVYNITPVDIRHPETDRDAMMPLNMDEVV